MLENALLSRELGSFRRAVCLTSISWGDCSIGAAAMITVNVSSILLVGSLAVVDEEDMMLWLCTEGSGWVVEAF